MWMLKMRFHSLLLLLFAISTFSLTAQQPAGWRGLNRDGVYQETGLLKSWPPEGPELLWSTSGVGKGYSSPVIAEGKIFVTGMNQEEDSEILTAYTLEGKQLYQVSYGSPWITSYPDTRTTPTVLNGRVYVISGMGEVVCLDAANGAILWKVDGEKQFGRTVGKWGTTESPLIIDNKVFFTPGGNQTTMVALDISDGKTLWQSVSLKDTCNHVSPLWIHHNGIDQIVGFSRNYMFGIDPANGDIKWSFRDWNFKPSYGNDLDGICINTPLYRDGKLFVSNAYGMKSFMFELNEDATDIRLIWRNEDLGVHTGGMVVAGDIIYASNWFSNNDGDWIALDWNTGQIKYKEAWRGGRSKGAIILADHMLYCYEERRGTVAMVNTTPEKFDVVSEFRISHGEGPHWAHPVIDNGILYIRHGSALMAYKIK